MTDGAYKAVCPHPVLIQPFCYDHSTGIALFKNTRNFFLSFC